MTRTSAAASLPGNKAPRLKLAAYPLGICLVALWLLLASFMVALSPPPTHLLAQAFVDAENSAYDHDSLVQVADDTRSYTAGLPVELPQGDDERIAFTPEVMGHLDDVRTVFVACEIAAVLVTLLLIVFAWLMLSRKFYNILAYSLIAGANIVIVVVLLLAVFGFVNFDAFFTALHRIFFAEGSWLFTYDSLLICALPESFWMGAGIVWAASLIVLCLGALALGSRFRRKANKAA